MKGKFVGGIVCGIAGMLLSIVICLFGMTFGYDLGLHAQERKSYGKD